MSFFGIDAVLLQQHVERTLGAAADHGNADGLALEIGDRLDRRIVLHRPIDRETAGLFEDVLRHDVGLQIAADHAVRQRQRRLRRAIERAGGQRLRHRRGALELGPFDIVGLAEIGKFRRPAHHPVFRFLGRNGPADADRLLRMRNRSHGKQANQSRATEIQVEAVRIIQLRSLAMSI